MDAFRISGEPKSQTVIFQEHVGVCGSSVQIINEEYSPSVRRYIVRRRTPHSSPDVAFLGSNSKLINLLSLFDIVLVMMTIIMCVPLVVGLVENYLNPAAAVDAASVIGDHLTPNAANTIAIPTASTDGGASAPLLVGDMGLLGLADGSGNSTVDGLIHFFTSVMPWFVLSKVETVLALVLTCMKPFCAPSSFFYRLHGSLYDGWLVEMVHPAAFWGFMICIFMAVKIPMRMSRIAEEEILIVQGVGIQITQRNFMGSTVAQRFIDVSLIRSIFIHEGFFRHRCIFFLGILVENRSDLEVLFQESLPRLAALRPILNGIRAVLYPSKKEFGPSLADIASGKAALGGNAPPSSSNVQSTTASFSGGANSNINGGPASPATAMWGALRDDSNE